MGQEIFYCDGCRTRLDGQEKAFRVGHQTFCAACAPKTPAPAAKRPPSDRGAQRVRPATSTPKAGKPMALWIALALGALLVIVAIAVSSKPGRGAPPKAEQPAP